MMFYLAIISIFFLGMQLFNLILNLIFNQKIQKSNTNNNELVSILIPTRNEEKNIGLLLSDLQKPMLLNIEIIVYDDESTDNTVQVVNSFTKKDKRISLINSGNLPDGWLGKNHACFQLANIAKGKHLLFLDADVRIFDNVIPDVLKVLKRYDVKLLSIFPTQIMKTYGEKITVPIMNYILLSLLPLIFVRISPFYSHAAANGQFMFFESNTYRKIQPHYLFKNNPVEDIAIARYYKKHDLKIACLTGEKRIRCRMYNSYKEAINGFSKNIIMFFGNSNLLAFIFWLLSAFGMVPILFEAPQFFIVYLSGIILLLMSYSIISKQNIIENIILFPLQLVVMLIVMINAALSGKIKKYEWKGRNIYS